MKSQSFCIRFDSLEAAAIDRLRAVHPGALPISIEWHCDGHGSGSAVIWWVPSPENADGAGRAGEQHNVTAARTGEQQHCIAGDPEGEGSGCAWSFHGEVVAKLEARNAQLRAKVEALTAALTDCSKWLELTSLPGNCRDRAAKFRAITRAASALKEK